MKKYVRKITAFSCALVFGISCTLQKMPEKALKISAENSVSDITDTVRVIVTLKDDSVFDRTGETDTDSDNAAEAFRTVVQEQNTVQDFIRDLYPDFKTNYSYSFLINGFSCELPEDLIIPVSRHPMVKSVSEVRSSQSPDMSDASGCGTLNWFAENTGCYGEGKVIAIIDNELEPSHDMFAPIDDKNNKLSKQDIENIINSEQGFNGNISDADEVYISSKLPFVFDYADGKVSDPFLYHGTHVAGIAAGNRIESENWSVSGTAPDAQIIFMGISDSDGTLNDDAVIAAVEDAVKLKADVINMSFSDKNETFLYNNPLKDAVSKAEQSGIIVCQASGNQGRRNNDSTRPNTGLLCETNGFPGVLSVASAMPDNNSPGIMNDFSSWGVSSSLKLEPDISGFGSDIISAGKSNDFCVMSGTSMASPYIAGCAAVAQELAEKNGYYHEGKERSLFIRNLLMNSAVPVSENSIYVSPRKQGAGIVDMQKLSDTSVILYGDSGEAKIELYDNVENEFSFDINIENFSKEDVLFSEAEMVLFTDNAVYYPKQSAYMIEGSVIIDHSTDISSLLSVRAGEKKKETISVRLDETQTNDMSVIFSNGFFIDGYILLKGSDNCADISVPLLGFFGDWNSKQLLKYTKYDGPTESLSSIIETAVSKYRKNEDYLDYLNNFIASDDQLYINPERTGFRSTTMGSFEFPEYCFRIGELIDNETGKTIFETEFKDLFLKTADSMICSDTEDGSYTLRIKAFTDFYKSTEDPETAEFQFVIDTVPPETDFSVSEKDGKKYLNIRSKDKNLDGFVIIGCKKDNSDSPDPAELLNTAGKNLKLTDEFYKGYMFSDLENMLDDSKRTLLTCNYNFVDAVCAEGDSMEIMYDVSDLDYYIAVSADKAYNFSFFVPENDENRNGLRPGTWKTSDNRFLYVDSTGFSGEFYSAYDDTSFDFKIVKNDPFYKFSVNDDQNKTEEDICENTVIFNSEFILVDSGASDNNFTAYYLNSNDLRTERYYNDERNKDLIETYANYFFDSTITSFENTGGPLIVHYKIEIINEQSEVSLMDVLFDTLSGYADVTINGEDFGKAAMYVYDWFDMKYDIDRNGTINAVDVITFQTFLLAPHRMTNMSQYDLNDDQSIDALDLVGLKNFVLNDSLNEHYRDYMFYIYDMYYEEEENHDEYDEYEDSFDYDEYRDLYYY